MSDLDFNAGYCRSRQKRLLEQMQQLDVIVEFLLSRVGDIFTVLYSNQAGPVAPQPVRSIPQGAATVQEVDGSTGRGPLHVLRVNLRPLEVQILRRGV